MFKGYLQEHPRFFQLSVFIGIWSTLQLITLMLIPQIISRIYGISDVNALLSDMQMDARTTQLFLVINGISTFLSFVLPPLLFASVAAPKSWSYLNLEKIKTPKIFWAVLMGVSLVFVIPVIGYFLQQINWGEAAMKNLEMVKQRNESIFSDKSTMAIARNLLVLALLPAIGEELFFRGMVQRFTNSWTQNPTRSIFFTAFFFAILHFQIVSFIPIFLGGIILGYLYYWTGNLWVSIFAHFVYNASQILLNAFQLDELNTLQYVIALAIGILACWIIIKQIQKNKTPLPQNWSVVNVNNNIVENENSNEPDNTSIN